MPEPPKITTSLADRIARLNATQKSSDKHHNSEKKEIGEIKSKISKYEATGQYEAPLVPKGSFGLGAPLTKPQRGLDRIRIASSGVSGGMKMNDSFKSASSQSSLRSISLGASQTSRLSSDSMDLGSQEPQSNFTPPPSLKNRPHSSTNSPIAQNEIDSPSSSLINQPTNLKDQHDQPSDINEDHSDDSNPVYDGILDGYPTTPAAEDGPPMVTCSNCLKSVELELLADHSCQLPPNHADSDHSDHDSLIESRQDFPVDVPEAPHHPAIETSTSESRLTSELSGMTLSTHDQLEHSNPSLNVTTPLVQVSPQPMIKENIKEQDVTDMSKVENTPTPLPDQSTNKVQTDLKQSKDRNSDSSSDSTNTTNRKSFQRPDFRGASPIYRNWHDDDDDDGYADSDGATGFVTIVRSSSRS